MRDNDDAATCADEIRITSRWCESHMMRTLSAPAAVARNEGVEFHSLFSVIFLKKH
jgi:hypothetical protein